MSIEFNATYVMLYATSRMSKLSSEAISNELWDNSIINNMIVMMKLVLSYYYACEII